MNVDTLSIARDLRAAELPPEQAEAIAAAIGRSMSEGAASRQDVETVMQKIESFERTIGARLDALERTTASRIDALDAQLTSKIDNARSTLLTWLMGVIVTTAGVVIAVLKL